MRKFVGPEDYRDGKLYAKHQAAEEVKEDDKEDSDEKKGFSMWESISRSVTPPAPTGTESPIHVKIEE